MSDMLKTLGMVSFVFVVGFVNGCVAKERTDMLNCMNYNSGKSTNVRSLCESTIKGV